MPWIGTRPGILESTCPCLGVYSLEFGLTTTLRFRERSSSFQAVGGLDLGPRFKMVSPQRVLAVFFMRFGVLCWSLLKSNAFGGWGACWEV